MGSNFHCLLCGKMVFQDLVDQHKREFHAGHRHYACFWQIPSGWHEDYFPGATVPSPSRIHACPTLAKIMGVRMIYVLNEGFNPSGSMKDYLTERAVNLGKAQEHQWYTVVSSGNHAVSLALAARRVGSRVIVFVPASSHKISFLCSFPNTIVFGVKDAVFEDVYQKYGLFSESLPDIYNANVCNELLLSGLANVSLGIDKLNPRPTHVLAGVGNGSYLAGFAWGILARGTNKTNQIPKIVPVGMQGAFPTEDAIRQGQPICEYTRFMVPEETIDAAEGSIAMGSYSMPQLVHAVKETQGFSAGGLTNDDLAQSYEVLCKEGSLLAAGIVPEPTGIMGLAAVLKYRGSLFGPRDVPLVVFTGHAVKDLDTVLKINQPDVGGKIATAIKKSSSNLEVSIGKIDMSRFHLLPKDQGAEVAIDIVKTLIRKGA